MWIVALKDYRLNKRCIFYVIFFYNPLYNKVLYNKVRVFNI